MAVEIGPAGCEATVKVRAVHCGFCAIARFVDREVFELHPFVAHGTQDIAIIAFRYMRTGLSAPKGGGTSVI